MNHFVWLVIRYQITRACGWHWSDWAFSVLPPRTRKINICRDNIVRNAYRPQSSQYCLHNRVTRFSVNAVYSCTGQRRPRFALASITQICGLSLSTPRSKHCPAQRSHSKYSVAGETDFRRAEVWRRATDVLLAGRTPRVGRGWAVSRRVYRYDYYDLIANLRRNGPVMLLHRRSHYIIILCYYTDGRTAAKHGLRAR